MRAAARSALLRLERLAARVLPSRVRRALGRFRSRDAEVVLEGWAAPLVAGRPSPTWPPVEPAAGVSATPSQVGPVGRVGDAIRCLLVTDSLDAGGVDEVVSLLARRLPAHGFDVGVLMASADRTKGIGRLGRELQARGVHVVDPLPADGPDALGAWRPDVVYVHGGGMGWPVDAAAELGVPCVLALHGMHDLFHAEGSQVVAAERRLAAVVAVSDLVRQEYLAKSPDLDPDKTVVIPNGVDLGKVLGPGRAASREALGLDDEILFVSLARHCLQKNTYALVDAFEDVARTMPSAHLLVCGRVDEPVYTRQLLALRDQSSARDRIHLRDNAHRTDVLLGAADAFVLDSFFEGWVLASMEALAAGVPVVISDVGGAREQMSGPVASGVLVSHPLGDPVGLTWDAMLRARYVRQQNRDELVDAMRLVARGDTLASRAQIAADARTRFDAGRSVAAHAELLRRLVAGAAPVARSRSTVGDAR